MGTFLILLCLVWGWISLEMYLAPNEKDEKKIQEYENDEEAIF